MACRGTTCYQGRAPCLSPERCGLLNSACVDTEAESQPWAWLDDLTRGAKRVATVFLGLIAFAILIGTLAVAARVVPIP